MKLVRALAALFAATLFAVPGLAPAQQAKPPLKIGFGMSLTGPLAGNGKAALIAMTMLETEVRELTQAISRGYARGRLHDKGAA